MIAAGFSIRHVEDFAPTAELIAENLGLAEECERPMMLLISAERSAAD